ncbi:MAG TPA: hypothetical protein VF475_17460 [Sphingobium sp.]
MDALLLALLLNLALDQGSGTQRAVARFGSRFAEGEDAPRGIVIGLALMVAINGVVGAGLGAVVATLLTADARLLFLSMALAMGGTGLMFAALRAPPTDTDRPITGLRTLLHFALRRAGENAAFATAGVAAFTDAPLLSAGGAIMGGWVALAPPLIAGCAMLRHWAMRLFQTAAGLAILCAGIGCAANALHLA